MRGRFPDDIPFQGETFDLIGMFDVLVRRAWSIARCTRSFAVSGFCWIGLICRRVFRCWRWFGVVGCRFHCVALSLDQLPIEYGGKSWRAVPALRCRDGRQELAGSTRPVPQW